ncbi:MAG: hypothetical protein KAV41_01965 [Candidatus Pacebacteria bacterium]|nr:hypothetical protein [Candidatus Paceibacterota bacterium]
MLKKNLIKLLNKEISGLHEAAYLLGFFTFFSQILALLRDRLLAHNFGAGEILDIYYASFRIPDFIFISIASLVSISVLVPFLARELEKGNARQFLDDIFSVFFVLIVLVSGVAFFLIPKITPFIFPGFSPETAAQVIGLSRVMLLSPIFFGLSNFFTSIIQIKKKFIIYALSPLLYNIGIIIGILTLYPVFGIKGLAGGVVLGAFFHMLIQLLGVYRLRFLPGLTTAFNFRRIKEIILLSLPRTLALSTNNLALIFLIGLASTMSEGSISVFNFSFSLQSIPLSIIGVSYSIAAFPSLAKLFSQGRLDEFLKQITAAARHIVFWATVALTLFVVLRAQIVRTILGSGKFDWVDTRLTAACLAAFALSVTAQSLVLLFVRAYYAAGRTRTPVWINIFSSICIVIFALGLQWFFAKTEIARDTIGILFRVSDISDINVLILPLSYSIGAILNAALLWFMFQKDFNCFSSEVKKSFWQTLVASIALGAVAYFSLELWNNIFDINTFWGIFLQGLLSGAGGIAILILTLKLLGNQEVDEIWHSIKQKLINSTG